MFKYILMACYCIYIGFSVLEMECLPLKKYSENENLPNQQVKKNESITVKMLSPNNATNKDAGMLIEIDHDYEIVSEETHVLSAVVDQMPNERKIANIYYDKSTQAPTQQPKSITVKNKIKPLIKIIKDGKSYEKIWNSPLLKINNVTTSKSVKEDDQTTKAIFIKKPVKDDSIKSERNTVFIIQNNSNHKADSVSSLKSSLKNMIPIYLFNSKIKDFIENLSNISEASAINITNSTADTDNKNIITALIFNNGHLQDETKSMTDEDKLVNETDLTFPYENSLNLAELPANYFESSRKDQNERFDESISERPIVIVRKSPALKSVNTDEQSTMTIMVNVGDPRKIDTINSDLEKETNSPIDKVMVIEDPADFYQLSNNIAGTSTTTTTVLSFKNISSNVEKSVPIVLAFH